MSPRPFVRKEGKRKEIKEGRKRGEEGKEEEKKAGRNKGKKKKVTLLSFP